MENARSDMQSNPADNVSPDWAAREKEIHCPLCGYNLRGLTESRCPECGFKFTWQELLNAEKDQQLDLFEYGAGRNIKTFWKTYWRTCRPRQFWREISPANEVRWVRLIVYWILASSVSVAAVLALFPFVSAAQNVASTTIFLRSRYKPVPGDPNVLSDGSGGYSIYSMMTLQQLGDVYPPPWRWGFWREVGKQGFRNYTYIFYRYSARGIFMSELTGWSAVFLGWPTLTLTTLMIFRISMRQAKIRTSHLVRAVIYSCDFGLLITILAATFVLLNDQLNQGSSILAFGVACAVLTTYRMTIAFRKYLRVHMPLATVLASQLIAMLILFLSLIPAADFSRML